MKKCIIEQKIFKVIVIMIKSLLTTCIFTFPSCNNTKVNKKLSVRDSIFAVENFDTSRNYSSPTCLFYKGKPLLTIGQNIKLLDTSLSYRPDPNGKYETNQYFLTDYLSLDDFYSTDLTTGSLLGALYFSTDKNGRIFRLNASWKINAELIDTSGMEIINFIHKKFFPCLPNDFKGRQSFELTHQDFEEHFKLYPLTDSAEKEHGFNPHWSLDYSISLIK